MARKQTSNKIASVRAQIEKIESELAEKDPMGEDCYSIQYRELQEEIKQVDRYNSLLREQLKAQKKVLDNKMDMDQYERMLDFMTN